jgi:hypothetical protein
MLLPGQGAPVASKHWKVTWVLVLPVGGSIWRQGGVTHAWNQTIVQEAGCFYGP